MKVLLIAFLFGLNFLANAQEFMFSMNFMDASGNRDTLIFGYDEIATIEADTVFGEIDISDSPYDSVFDVRISKGWQSGNPTPQFKKQIYPRTDKAWDVKAFNIEIKCSHWPIHISWDSSLFTTAERNGSVFTSLPPPTWWDIGSPNDFYYALLKTTGDTSIFNYKFNVLPDRSPWIYRNKGDTISVFFLAFGDSTIHKVDVPPTPSEDFAIWPNPVKESMFISPIFSKNDYSLEIFDLNGRLVKKIMTQDNVVDIGELGSGTYWLLIQTEQSAYLKKISKQ